MDVSENSEFSTQIIHLSCIHSGLPLLLKTHPFWGPHPVDTNLHNRESGQKLGKSLPWLPRTGTTGSRGAWVFFGEKLLAAMK